MHGLHSVLKTYKDLESEISDPTITTGYSGNEEVGGNIQDTVGNTWGCLTIVFMPNAKSDIWYYDEFLS